MININEDKQRVKARQLNSVASLILGHVQLLELLIITLNLRQVLNCLELLH